MGFFKYYNFFSESFGQFLLHFGLKVNLGTLQVILPIGISFYTFHGLSYVIDLYKERINPEKNLINYSLFVSFFPLLVAGPIERATHLLPQIIKSRVFKYNKAIDDLRQILWGLFKKIVIADSCAEFANTIFNNSKDFPGSTLVLGSLFFSIQIYCDFSGYSDIALGTARLFGIDLLKNFAFPYFSRDIAEFWRRWHISLSSWFKDYLYIPLGGSKKSKLINIRNTFLIFIVSGFWHGANWTFIIWGFLNAIYILPLIIIKQNRTNIEIVAKGKYFPTIAEFLNILFTFGLTTFSWIFFRANNLNHAFDYISKIFSKSLFVLPVYPSIDKQTVLILFLVLIFICIEWLGRESQFAIENIRLRLKRPVAWFIYSFLLFFILYYAGNEQQFIYFQF